MSKIASIPTLQPSASCVRSRAGSFQLQANQAVSLRPNTDTAIRITCGSAWVTLGDGKDYFLQKGQSLKASRGSAVVIEPLYKVGAAKGIETLYFDWNPVPVKVPKASRHQRMRVPAQHSQQQKALAQAWGDFRLALTAGFLAGARLAGALLGLPLPAALRASLGLVARARNAHSNARAAHGRMASCESIASSGAV